MDLQSREAVLDGGQNSTGRREYKSNTPPRKGNCQRPATPSESTGIAAKREDKKVLREDKLEVDGLPERARRREILIYLFTFSLFIAASGER